MASRRRSIKLRPRSLVAGGEPQPTGWNRSRRRTIREKLERLTESGERRCAREAQGRLRFSKAKAVYVLRAMLSPEMAGSPCFRRLNRLASHVSARLRSLSRMSLQF
jgi:hypothetical protein